MLVFTYKIFLLLTRCNQHNQHTEAGKIIFYSFHIKIYVSKMLLKYDVIITS